MVDFTPPGPLVPRLRLEGCSQDNMPSRFSSAVYSTLLFVARDAPRNFRGGAGGRPCLPKLEGLSEL